jgi:hypothetical protein
MWVPVFSPDVGGIVFLKKCLYPLTSPHYVTSECGISECLLYLFQAELELLLMNEGTEKSHFSLKSIQEEEVEGKKRHKKKGKKKLIKEESKQDDFEVIFWKLL